MTEGSKIEYVSEILNSLENQELEIDRVVDADYFSGVIIAKNEKLGGRLESIKFIDAIDPTEKENFLREGKILGILKHKNIPRVYDLLFKGDLYIYRIEHINGFTLQDVLDEFKKRDEKIPVNVAVDIISKLSKALHYVHNDIEFDGEKVCVIHGDIKPSNIILSSKFITKDKIDSKFLEAVRNNHVEPHLIDFGIAKFTTDDQESFGTVNYMSPSQVDSKNNTTWRDDYHQLMLVFSEMLLGEKPYNNKKRKEIIEAKLNLDFKLSDSNKFSNSIKELIETVLVRDNSKSFSTENEIITKLQKINRKEKQSKWVRDNKTPIASVLIFLFVIMFSFVGYNMWDYHTQSVDAIIKKY